MTEAQKLRKAATGKAWREKNHERKRATTRAWKAANTGRIRKSRRAFQLLTKFNLTVEQWDAKLASQGNCCASCGTTEPGGKHKQWHTDHCHETNIVRGILCNDCNLGIGKLGDNAAGVGAALAYLERFECKTMNSTQPTSQTVGPLKASTHTELSEMLQPGWSAGLM